MQHLLKRNVSIGILQVGIILLTLFTALFHLQLALEPDSELRVWFMLNCLGYIALLIALYLPQTNVYHHIIRYVLIGYTALTIFAWFILAQPYDAGDLPVKIAEVALIVLLIAEDRQSRRFSRL